MKRDIETVVNAVQSHDKVVVKVIIETGRLADKEREAGAHFVKTPT